MSLSAAGLLMEIELGKGTSDRCGQCKGCKSSHCGECSACKRGAFEDCIDAYCQELESGREQRAAARELYIKSLSAKMAKSGDEADLDDSENNEPTMMVRKTGRWSPL